MFGWVYNKRSSGSIAFLQLRDGTGFIQATVIKSEVNESVFKSAQDLTQESSVVATGLLHAEKRAPGGFEISVTALKPIHISKDEFPIGKKDHGPDFLLSYRHLWLRSKRQWAIQMVRNEIIRSINEFFQKDNFVRIDTPIITPSACEGTTTLFEIDYFGEKAYLSQSGQLYLEAAIASVGRCYDFSPVLRAEKSKTRRHLIEFWMMDAEAAFMEFEDLLDLEERSLHYIIQNLLKNCQNEFAILERDLAPLKNIKLPFKRIRYATVLEELRALGSDIKEGEDFGSDDETMLMEKYKEPIFVTHFPSAIKPFYCKRSENSRYALAVDLLAPEGYGEIYGGSERENNYDILKRNIIAHKIDLKDYEWYLDLRKYGSVPHSGFGLGLERIIAWVCKLEHVRETIPFPRLLERFRP